jgi:glycosyltransferase involved in cell wall biosynthesis
MYLDSSIGSALNQTYENIEIIFLDNCSTDNSVEIASQYVNRGVRICKNPNNLANKSIDLLTLLAKGKYFMTLFADDLIKPTLVEKCVNIMEANQNVGYVHCERDFIDEDGKITDLDPFFNCSFISPGESVLPIYLLADVAQAPQALVRRTSFNSAMGYSSEFDHVNADKDLWFRLSLISDYAYVREKLSLIRIHKDRETVKAIKNFYHPLALYLTINQQARLAFTQDGHKNVINRIPVAYKKLAIEFINFSLIALNEKNVKLAKKYMLFSRILDKEIISSDLYQQYVKNYNYVLSNPEKEPIHFEQDMYSHRKRNYNPPDEFSEINMENYASKTL